MKFCKDCKWHRRKDQVRNWQDRQGSHGRWWVEDRCTSPNNHREPDYDLVSGLKVPGSELKFESCEAARDTLVELLKMASMPLSSTPDMCGQGGRWFEPETEGEQHEQTGY